MSDILIFKDVLAVPQHYAVWLLAALALGAVTGWLSCRAGRTDGPASMSAAARNEPLDERNGAE